VRLLEADTDNARTWARLRVESGIARLVEDASGHVLVPEDIRALVTAEFKDPVTQVWCVGVVKSGSEEEGAAVGGRAVACVCCSHTPPALPLPPCRLSQEAAVAPVRLPCCGGTLGLASVTGLHGAAAGGSGRAECPHCRAPLPPAASLAVNAALAAALEVLAPA
jgi:hypothetical protein